MQFLKIYLNEDPLNFADVSTFLTKLVPLLKAIVWKVCYRYFSSIFGFFKMKDYY